MGLLKGVSCQHIQEKCVAKFKYMDTRLRIQYHAQNDIKDNTKFGEPLFTTQVRVFSLSVSHFKGRENWSLTSRQDHKSDRVSHTNICIYIHIYIVYTYFLTLHNKQLYILLGAGIATRLRAGPSGNRFSAVPREFSSPEKFQTRSGNHPVSYSKDRGFFPVGKAARTRYLPLTSIWCRG